MKSLCTVYEQTGRISDQLSDDYAIMVLYSNEREEYVDSLVFTHKENIPNAQDKNGWVPLGSGSLATNDEILDMYLKDGSLENYIAQTGIENISGIKLITSIPHMPACLYFEQQGDEFFLPLEDGLAGMRSTQIYRAGDVVEDVLYPILTYQQDLHKKYSGEMIFGVPLVPDNLLVIEPVKSDIFIRKSTEDYKEIVYFPVLENFNFFWKSIMIVLPILIIAGLALWLKTEQNNHIIYSVWKCK